ncbi:MAG TPA: hypothetical protein DCF93_09015 [Desulfuromonas sp.]|nr:hypothetical protein [Desulfuromonas sp.]
MATPAFALTADTKGFLEIRGQADRNLNDGSDRGEADNDRTGVEQRLRLWTEVAADENVKAVFAIESDLAWGANSDSLGDIDGNGTDDSKTNSIGTDYRGNLEIKHVYLDFNLPSLKTNVKAGAQYFKIGGGFIAGDDAIGIQTATKFGDAATLKLYWAKAQEGSVDVTSDDNDFYGAQVDVKAGPVTVSPILAWTRSGKDTDIYFGGFDLAGKLGENTKLAVTLIKNWGDNLGVQNVDGLAAYAGVFQKMGSADLSLEGAWIGDDGQAGGQFVDGSGSIGTWGLSSPTEMLGGARYDRRAVIGQGIGGRLDTGDGDLYNLNQCYVKLGFGLQTSEKTKLTTYLAHIQQASGDNDGISTAFGQELGAYYDITLAKGLTYSLMGAYLLNDDFGTVGGGNDNVYKLGNALTYKF